MQNSKVIVITLNYNQTDYTIKCVDSLLKSDYKNFHILLIDNGSTKENYVDLKKSLSQDERIILKRLEPNRGYVGGINFGMETGSLMDPDYYIIMNNDTVIDKNAISELVKTEEKYDQKVIVTGKVYHYDDPERLQDVGYYFRNKKTLLYHRIGMNELDKGQYDKEEERDLIDDVFWLFPYKLYETIGGYSPYLWFNYEQADFALRAKEEGYKLIYTPKAKLWHKGSVSIGGRDLNPLLAYWEVQSSLIFNYIHLNILNFLRFMIPLLVKMLKTSGKSFLLNLKGDEHLAKYAYAKRQGFYYFFKWLFKRNINAGILPKGLK